MKKFPRTPFPSKAELKRRAERGTTYRCPKCGCTKVLSGFFSKHELAAIGIDPGYGPLLSACSACKALWEPIPEGLHLDDDGRPFPLPDPCDNCAFRPQSREQLDREKWRETLEALKGGGRFYCHKGVPIEPGAEHGFAYPKTRAGEFDMSKFRVCRGFLNAWGRWMEREFGAADVEMVSGKGGSEVCAPAQGDGSGSF